MDKVITGQVLSAWKTHNEINLLLISAIPSKGLDAVPYGSRGRTVMEQLVHMNRVREGWLYYHKTGKRPKLPRAKDASFTKTQLKKMFADSGKRVAGFLKLSLEGKTKPKMFGGKIVNWFGYLLSHEAHHRGSIMLALKQNGIKMPDKISLEGLWYTWIAGRKG